MNNFNLITQYDPNKDETSCIMSMTYNRKDIDIAKADKPDMNDKNNYIDLYQKNLINNYPSLFIFLIDQSGSMSGKPIALVKETLLFFLQSLPKNSFYQLIGFGSSVNYIYSEEPVEYTVDNVNETISEIKDQKEGAMTAVIDLNPMYDFREKCRCIDDIRDNYEVKI